MEQYDYGEGQEEYGDTEPVEFDGAEGVISGDGYDRIREIMNNFR